MFVQYLGGSLASAAVNLTQPVLVSLPYLAQFGGAVQAARQMLRASQDALKRWSGDKALDAALRLAEEQGVVSPQEVHQLMAQAGGHATLRSGDGTRAGDALAKAQNFTAKSLLAWGKVFSAPEQFNRRVTFIAAYRTAQAQRMADPGAFATDAVAQTQFTYNKGNKPKWARGAVGSTLFTFKQFGISYVELLARMGTAGAPGSAERKAGQRAALLGLGMLVLMSGIDGLPFEDDLEDLIDGLMQKLGYNWSTKLAKREAIASLFGEEFTQFMLKGVSGVPGLTIDVSGRLGLGNLIPGTGLLTTKDDHTRDVAEVFGVVGDLAMRGVKAGGQLFSGEVGEAAKTIAPKAIYNMLKGYDMAMTGAYKDDRGYKVIDTTEAEALFKFAGFQPSSVARVQEGLAEGRNLIALNKSTESQIAAKWARGIYEGDDDAVVQARSDLAQWNTDNPDSRIRINFVQIRRRVQAMREDKETRLMKTAPKEIRAAVRQQLEGTR